MKYCHMANKRKKGIGNDVCTLKISEESVFLEMKNLIIKRQLLQWLILYILVD